ncbi:Protein TraQ (plasmid) [Escherichia coli]|nr:Protein TraQ [Escherichia coli]
MISKRRFSLPRLDITGMWVFSLGVWFHIVARLVYSKPWMAFFLAELIAVPSLCCSAHTRCWMHGLPVSAGKSVRHWKPGNRP